MLGPETCPFLEVSYYVFCLFIALMCFFFVFPRDTNEKSFVDAFVSPIPEAAAEKIKKVFGISEKEASKESWLSYLGQMSADLFWNYKYEIIGFFLIYISMRVLLSVVKKKRKKVLENHKRSDKKHYEEFKKTPQKYPGVAR